MRSSCPSARGGSLSSRIRVGLRGQVHAEDRLRDRVVQVTRQAVAFLLHCQVRHLVGVTLELMMGNLQFVEGVLIFPRTDFGFQDLVGISAEEQADAAV